MVGERRFDQYANIDNTTVPSGRVYSNCLFAWHSDICDKNEKKFQWLRDLSSLNFEGFSAGIPPGPLYYQFFLEGFYDISNRSISFKLLPGFGHIVIYG